MEGAGARQVEVGIGPSRSSQRAHQGLGASGADREMADMERLTAFASRLLQDDSGQDLIEYALLATFVSLVAIAGATLLGTALDNWYSAVTDKVDDAAAKAGGGS
jgi:pilus assembly protein Flp/PilA